MPKSLLTNTGNTREISMETFLRLFREAYGTAENYLTGLGLTDGEILKLREKRV